MRFWHDSRALEQILFVFGSSVAYLHVCVLYVQVCSPHSSLMGFQRNKASGNETLPVLKSLTSSAASTTSLQNLCSRYSKWVLWWSFGSGLQAQLDICFTFFYHPLHWLEVCKSSTEHHRRHPGREGKNIEPNHLHGCGPKCMCLQYQVSKSCGGFTSWHSPFSNSCVTFTSRTNLKNTSTLDEFLKQE